MVLLYIKYKWENLWICAPGEILEKLKAVKAGVSEVYFGLRGFGARRNNENFPGIQDTRWNDYAHARGVKTLLLTLNTLMKDVEIEDCLPL